jgi:hypothetical protein
MMTGRYQLTASRGNDEILRQGFDDLDEADHALADVLARYPDCEIRLTREATVLLSVAPSRRRVG